MLWLPAAIILAASDFTFDLKVRGTVVNGGLVWHHGPLSRTGGWYFTNRQAAAEIGSAYAKVDRIIQRHYGGQGGIQFRAAPSIICRSELELLGVAAPRFAFRTLIQSMHGTGFLNCRRLSLLNSSLEREIEKGLRDPDGQFEELGAEAKLAADELQTRVRLGSPVAESVLPLPDSLSDYHVISREYGALFGETMSMRGTIFATAIELGGGLCSQGACFMASLMRLDDVLFVHGPSEITSLLRENSEPGKLRLDGLTFDEIVRYFRHQRVRLNSYREIGPIFREPASSLEGDSTRQDQELQLVAALRSYLLSDIPVIVLLDAAKYCQLVLRNERNSLRVELPQRSGHHCILLVGTRVRDGQHPHSMEFLAHDPIVAPWVRISADELAKCRVHLGESGDLHGVMVYPVLPGKVASHLLSAPSDPNHPRGLLGISSMLQRSRGAGKLGFPDDQADIDRLPRATGFPQFCQFLLVDLERVRREGIGQRTHLSIFCDDDTGWLAELAAGPLREKSWLWLQRLKHEGERYSYSLWGWEAEKSRSPRTLTDVLCFVATNDNDEDSQTQWQIAWKSATLAGNAELDSSADPGADRLCHAPQDNLTNPAVTSAEARQALDVSLITSFIPTKAKVAKRYWPTLDSSLVGCELYAFMLKDRGLLPPSGESHAADSLHARLNALRNDDEAIRKLASRVSAYFPPHKRPIRAIASYIPEIAKPADWPSSQLAIGSLECLCKLALTLKRDIGQPVSAIELVGGSRVVGIDWTEIVKDLAAENLPNLSVRIENRSIALRNVVQAIQSATSALGDELRASRIALAIELEPGELYTLSDLDAIEELLELVDKNTKQGLNQILGFNLDLGHFAMARHLANDQPSWDLAMARIADHLIHCHASSHSLKGHFGDGPLPASGLDPGLRSILEHYRLAVARRRRLDLPTSGSVSLELEAAAGPEVVQDSVTKLLEVTR
ncbi:MAG: hypothetical protein J5I93_22450 [Pirellulaceae bacterium]|nr:hypothetical protein [Pirellulaceae bacterium]